MTPKQKAAVKHNIKLKWLHGEITTDEYDDLVSQLDSMAKAGASLQDANSALGLYKKKSTGPAAKSGPKSAPKGMTQDEYIGMWEALNKKKKSGLITDAEYYALGAKLDKAKAEKKTAVEIEKEIGCDPGTLETDKSVLKMGKELKGVYQQASGEMKAKLDRFLAQYGPEMKELEKKFINGQITEDELRELKLRTMQKAILTQKTDQLTGTMLNANQKALAMIRGEQLHVFAENANFQSYQLTQDTKMNLMFSVFDEHTAEKLVKEKPELLPRKEVNGKKDAAWNRKIIAGAVLQGVIQGDSIPKLAKRIAADTGETNMKAMLRYARTAMTSAQNSGRMEMLHRAQGMGVQVRKTWLATLDSRTRDSHQHMDGKTVGVDDKFPNGLMYPGDPGGPPAEVYNCRCTLIYEYEGFPNDPTADQRISYDEWDEEVPVKKKDKNGKEYDAKKIVHHRESRLITDMSYDEWKTAKAGSKLNDLNAAKYQLAEAQKAVVKAGVKEDKVYEGLWKDPVTLKDYPAKKAGIQAKRDYYDTEIEKYKQAQAAGSSWATDEKISELEKKKKLLNELEKRGALVETRDNALKAVQDIYDQTGYQGTAAAPMVGKIQKTAKKAAAASGEANTGTAGQTGAGLDLSTAGEKKTPFTPDAYSKERKDKALWSTDKAYVDGFMRGRTSEVWTGATAEQRDAIFEYTQSYHKYNEPLRGIEYGTSQYKGVGKTNLNANYANNGERLNRMTDIIDKCSYDHDMWLQRGCRFGGMDKFFQCDMSLLQSGSQKELEQELLGKTVTEYGFMSMGSAKGKGFDGDIMLNVYAPSGTKMMYVEPFSYYGYGKSGSMNGLKGLKWNGKTTQPTYGREFETIMQQGTQFRVTKVDKSRGKIWVDIEVINQEHQQRWTP